MAAEEHVRWDPSAGVPPYARLRNAVRIAFIPERRGERGLDFIIDDLLAKHFGIQVAEIFALYEHPRAGYYDVILTTEGIYKDFLVRLERIEKKDELGDVHIIPHFDGEVTLTVLMFSPYIGSEEIEVFLKLFCSNVKPLGKVLNERGIWTGKRRYRVSFNGNMRPPARFCLGKTNGNIFFNGMGTFCRNCKEYGHETSTCEKIRCQNCGAEGHFSASCKALKKCHLCQKEGHLFANCPDVRKSGEEKEKGKKATQPPDPQTKVAKEPTQEKVKQPVVKSKPAKVVQVQKDPPVKEAAGEKPHIPVQVPAPTQNLSELEDDMFVSGLEESEEEMEVAKPEVQRKVKKDVEEDPKVLKHPRMEVKEGEPALSKEKMEEREIENFFHKGVFTFDRRSDIDKHLWVNAVQRMVEDRHHSRLMCTFNMPEAVRKRYAVCGLETLYSGDRRIWKAMANWMLEDNPRLAITYLENMRKKYHL